LLVLNDIAPDKQQGEMLLPHGGISMTASGRFHTTFGSFMLSPFAQFTPSEARGLRVNYAKHPGIFSAMIEPSDAGALLPHGGIRMTGGGVFLYE
jgi:hypothetical protein